MKKNIWSKEIPSTKVVKGKALRREAMPVMASAAAVSNGSTKITSFKVEQKIVNMESDNSINAGGFAKGESNVKRLTVLYQVVMFSDQYQTVPTGSGALIRRRLGYGYGFTVDLTEINSKISFNFSIIAASVALQNVKANYVLNVSGVLDPSLVAYAPSSSGDFTFEAFDKLKVFIGKAKQYLSTATIANFYPIEVLSQINVKMESSDTESIYFGVKKVTQGMTLKGAIDQVRQNSLKKNENIIQFIYKYFGLDDAYSEPTQAQKKNANDWLEGKFSKTVRSTTNGTWVAIEPSVVDGKFLVLSGTAEHSQYVPHALPATWATDSKVLDITKSEVSVEFSSSLKLAALADTSGKFNTQTLTREITLYKDYSGVHNSKVVETRYGVGLRLTLRITQLEFGTEVNYATVGAISELGYANVEFEISGIGISDPAILATLPGPQSITQNTLKDIDAAFDAVKNKLATMNVSSLSPQPFMIRVEDPEKIDPTLDAQAIVFCYRQIGGKKTLQEAINKGVPVGINADTIKKIYRTKFGVTDLNGRITNALRDRAYEWMDV